jgi:hypothetical protein
VEDRSDLGDLVACLSGQTGVIKLEQHVRQVHYDPTFGFAGVQFPPLQLFQEGSVAGDLSTLLLNQLLLRVESLISRVELTSYRVATNSTQTTTNGRTWQRFASMAADDRSTTRTQQTA